MKKHTLHELFIEELKDMYSSEHQIVKSLPKLIEVASSEELKEALSHHLKETKEQVARIEKIFSILGVKPTEMTCEAMQGLIREADELVKKNQPPSPVLDAAIISAAQKVEHYEIASYGTLGSFAKQLDFDEEVIDLINDTLDEEAAADKKLTKIAVGSLFTSGVNKEASEGHLAGGSHRKRR